MKSYLRRLLGQARGGDEFVGTDRLVPNWTFRASPPDHMTAMMRRSMRRKLVAPPPTRVVTPVTPRRRWALYFIYAPDGRLRPSHRFTLRQLRSEGTGLAVVFASPPGGEMPAELVAGTDALFWKGLSGFDFSAYAMGLRALADNSPGADVLVMNDSVFGPFCPLDALWARMPWDLTGFTASGNVQNHIQSYAFMLRDWDRDKYDDLAGILRLHDAYDDYRHVVFCQETLFAEHAAKTMSVGSWWYADHQTCADVSIHAALSLVEAGFPFMKKSLFTKYAHALDQKKARDVLAATGHPSPDQDRLADEVGREDMAGASKNGV